jgi:hypothetical protein
LPPPAASGCGCRNYVIARRCRYNSAMLRRLFTVLSALSLLLCVATLVLWVRSYRGRDTLSYRSTASR